MSNDKIISNTVEKLRQEASEYTAKIFEVLDDLATLWNNDYKDHRRAYGDKKWNEIFATEDEVKQQLMDEFRYDDFTAGNASSCAGSLAIRKAFYDALGKDVVFIPENIRYHHQFRAEFASQDVKQNEKYRKTTFSKCSDLFAYDEAFKRTYATVAGFLQKPEFANILAQANTDIFAITLDMSPEQYFVIKNGEKEYGLAAFGLNVSGIVLDKNGVNIQELVKHTFSTDDVIPEGTLVQALNMVKRRFAGEIDGVSCSVFKYYRNNTMGHFGYGNMGTYNPLPDTEHTATLFETILKEAGEEIYISLTEISKELVGEAGFALDVGNKIYNIGIKANNERIRLEDMTTEEIVKLFKSIYDKLVDFHCHISQDYNNGIGEEKMTADDIVKLINYILRGEDDKRAQTVGEIIDVVFAAAAPLEAQTDTFEQGGYTKKIINPNVYIED